MKKRTCLHPIKANRIIEEFANQAATPAFVSEYNVELEDGLCYTVSNCANINEFIKWHNSNCVSNIIGYEDNSFQPFFHVVRNENKTSANFAMAFELDDNNCYDIYVPCWKTVDYNDDIAGKCFRKNFVSRCSLAKGFADVTISVLHEIGHNLTKELIPEDFDRENQYFDTFFEAESEEELQNLYFAWPDETLATDWAIEWLSDPEHRKLAKAFEKKFFACFSKN